MKTDDDYLIFVENLDAAAAASLDPVTRGGQVAGQCRSCHSMEANAPSGIGPNLWNVVGRPVASLSDYAYSEALASRSGNWTEDRLRTFIDNPGAFAPGTRIQNTATYTYRQLDDLIVYLRTLR